MPNREAPFKIVPRVFCEDGGGYSRPAVCVHCGKPIPKVDLAWGSLVSDPDGPKRPVHTACLEEYSLFVAAFNVEPE